MPDRPLARWIPVAGLAFVAAGLLTPLPRVHRIWGVPMDLAHIVLGAGLTWAVAWALRRWRPSISRAVRPWLAAIAASLILAALEAAQGLTGRSASLHDVVANALGTLGMAVVLAAPKGQRRMGFMLALLPWLVAAAYPLLILYDTVRQPSQLPQLSGLEDNLEMTRWAGRGTTLERTRAWHSAGAFALEARFHPGPWPSVTLIHPAPNWQGWRALAFDVHAPVATRIHVKVMDRAHNEAYDDRFNDSHDLHAGWQTIEIPIAAIQRGPAERELDLARIDAVQWFLTDVETETVLRIDEVRLLR